MTMDIEQIPVSDDVLAIMRKAATRTLATGEQFISPRAMMIALINDASMSEPFKEVVDLEVLENLGAPAAEKAAVQIPEERMGVNEEPAFPRYDTLAFKDETGSNTVWLNVEAHAVFLEGARRTEGRYLPKHLALGFATEARRTSTLLTDLKIDPAKFSEIAFAL